MKKRLLLKTVLLFTIFLLVGLGLTPITTSNKINEQTYTTDILLTKSIFKTDDTKNYLQNEKDLDQLKNFLSNNLQLGENSDITIDGIIKLIKDMLIDNPSLLRKNIIISQGWSYDTNIFKHTKLQIKHDLFSLWHYTKESKTGIKSKTYVIQANELMASKTIGLYRGAQTGFMFRPIGFYLFQKMTVPQLSHTLFIGFASYVYINAEEVIQIPFTIPQL